MKEVFDRVPLSKTEIYRRIADGRFPEPVRIGDRRIAFVEAEISAWISDQIEKSRNTEN
ncbi:MAG: AlpA family phage regulatory protein [Pseudomonadota bacterium]